MSTKPEPGRREIIEGIFLIAVTIFLAVLGRAGRYAFVFTWLAASLPVAVMFVKFGYWWTGGSLAVVLAVLMLLGSPLEAAEHFVWFCVPGLSIGWLSRQRQNFLALLSGTALSYILSFLILAWIRMFALKSNVVNEYIIVGMKGVFARILDFFLYLMPFAFDESFRNNVISGIANQYAPFIPAWMLIISLVISYIILRCFRFVSRRMGVETIEYPSLADFYVPRGIFFAVLVSFLLFMLGDLGQAVMTALANILMLLLFVYALQGLSFIEFHFSKYSIPILTKCLFYGVILVIYITATVISVLLPPLSFASPYNWLVLLGIIDGSFHIRKGRQEGEKYERQ